MPSRSLSTAALLLGGLLALAPAAARAQDDLPKAETVLKGFTASSGLFTVHRKGHDVFLEVPAGQLGAPFLLATTVTGGPDYAGYQWSDTVCAWERLDKRLLLVEREVRYRVKDPRKPMAEVVKRTYTDAVLHAMPIAALNGQNPVVDAKALFAGNASVFFGRLAARLDAQTVQVEKAKTFPQNVELALTLPDRGREGRLTTLAYSLSALPRPEQDRYQPRAADDRVGYFLTAVKDFTDDAAGGDRFVRLVNRWQLEKADPSLERSPVKEPIVFYVEKTVPFRFRHAVASGILEWNRAFEAVGLLGAVVVRQQTDTEFADLDPEDVRYNFFRWIVSDRAFAMGPSRVNPWTGQILDADIIFDESMVRVHLREYDYRIKESPKQFFSPEVRRLLERDPARFSFAHAPEGARHPDDALPEHLPGAMGGRGHAGEDPRACALGPGVAHQAALGVLALDLAGRPGKPGEYPEAFMNEIVKDVVMHEVGHTLGLRHNFRASAWRPLAEINGEARPDDITASVMDYTPVNIKLGEEGTQGAWSMRTLGPYDLWAIQYGYAPFPDEAAGLKATVASVASPQYAYGTDEDTTGPDPYIVRWDLGQDPLEFAQGRMALAARMWPQVVDRVVKDGDGFQDARRAFDMLMYDYQSSAVLAARYVGGQHVTRHHKGDAEGRDPIAPIDAATQRRALALLCERVLAEGNLTVPPEVLRKLAKGNWSHWGSTDRSRPHSYPYFQRVLDVQSWVVFGLLNPGTIERLVDAEAKVAPDADLLTVPEVFEAVTKAVFGAVVQGGPLPAGTARKPAISTIQRNLQRHYAGELIQMALEGETGSTPPVARMFARQELRRLQAAIAGLDLKGADPYTAAHLQELQVRIARALEAQFQLGGGGGGGGGSIVIQLGRPAGDEEAAPVAPRD